jgi:NitT/TauT family transport system substrate-binding protein
MTVPSTIRLTGGAQGFNWLPVFVAEELGLFDRHGLKITYLKVGSVDKATAAVLQGDADVAITPPEGAITNFVAGGALRIIAANSNRLPMSLVAAPSIKSIGELGGKSIGTSSLTEGTAIYTQIMLREHGLAYPGDYQFKLAGIHTKRWEALQAGEIDCAPQPAPWNFLAQNAGYNLIGEVSEAIPEIVFAGLVANIDYLRSNSEPIGRLIKALAEAHTVVNDHAREDVTAPIFQRLTTQDDASLAIKGLRYMRDMGMWPVGLAIPDRALETSIDLMIRANLLIETHCAQARGAFDQSHLQTALR